jgi:hypothetical protein
LQQFGGKKTEVARLLGVSRFALKRCLPNSGLRAVPHKIKHWGRYRPQWANRQFIEASASDFCFMTGGIARSRLSALPISIASFNDASQ